MIDAMLNEIRLAKVSPFGGDLEGADTVYFGGGTPSLLTVNELKKLLDAAHQYFDIAKDAEITL